MGTMGLAQAEPSAALHRVVIGVSYFQPANPR